VKYDIVTEALIVEAKRKARLKKETLVNLPLYGIAWQDRLTYKQFIKKYNAKPLLSHCLPQCHICTRFETESNPLFAYSYLERNGDYKFIYRCENGHGHDHGMLFLDVHTGLEVYC
jgi:hypothetical protein